MKRRAEKIKTENASSVISYGVSQTRQDYISAVQRGSYGNDGWQPHKDYILRRAKYHWTQFVGHGLLCVLIG